MVIKPLHKAITEVLLVALIGALLGVFISDTPINSTLLLLPQTAATEPSPSRDYIQSNTQVLQE
jgi:hypothetical protein